MSEKDNPTPAQEVNEPEQTVNEQAEETVSEALGAKPKIPDNIPYHKFKEVNDQKKELEAKIEELSAKAKDENLSKSEISSDLKTLAKEHDVDEEFLAKLASTIKAQAEANLEERLKPLTERERAQQIDAAFEKAYAKTIDNMPEYADVANPEVIKQLSLLPQNQNKTFREIVEETYSNSLSGKRTIETTTPGGGKEPQTVDADRARKEPEYFKKVMSDPKLKEQYNSDMMSRLMNQL